MIVSRIPEAFIQEVLSRVDIVEVIDSRIPIKNKKTGTNYVACCPFHHEKTPSFSVNQAKQFYHCFGCGVHGDAINFLKEFEGVSFVDALEKLATSVGLTVPKDLATAQRQATEQPLYQLMAQVAEYYQHQLKQRPNADKAIAYLQNRGLTGEIAKEYGMGFAPEAWDSLVLAFGKTSEDQERLQKVGLLIQSKENRLWDRFRNRVMFPIRDPKGRVLGFGGRVLSADQTPKYLNSPETPLFHKSECLFGLYELLKRQPKIASLIVVEGYMDVIALTQHGILGAVATLGTAITEQHLKKLFHYSSDIIFCFDGDTAGRQAALKAMHIMLPLLQDGYEVKFSFLPDKTDPDNYIRTQGVGAFKALLDSSLVFSEYFFNTLLQQVEPSSIDRKAKFVKLAKPLLEQLPKGIFKEMMFQRLSEIVSVNVLENNKSNRRETYLRSGYTKQRYEKNPNNWEKNSTLVGRHSLSPAMLAALLLIRQPEFLGLLPERGIFERIEAHGVSLLVEVLNLLKEQPELTSEQIQKLLANKDQQWVNLPIEHPAIKWVPLEKRQQVFMDTTQYLISFAIRQLSQQLLDSSKIRELSAEEKDQLKRLLESRQY